VKKGHAKLDEKVLPKLKRKDELIVAEEEAKRSTLGIWAKKPTSIKPDENNQ